MRLYVVLLLLLLGSVLLNACAVPLTPVAAARDSAEQTGCWPYGVYQPPTPTLVPPATPGLAAATPGATPRPSPSPAPTVRAYPSCTPIPGTPTITPSPIPQETPQSALPIGGQQEIAQTAGMITDRLRQVHTPAIGIALRSGTVTLAWYAWGGGTDIYAGDVWIRAQTANGAWYDAQTVNTTPTKMFLGGLGITYTISDVITVAYGTGDGAGGQQVYTVDSADGGRTWSQPRAVAVGKVETLVSDMRGGLHILVLTPPLGGAPMGLTGTPRYGVRAPGATQWQWMDLPTGLLATAQFALLELPDGRMRRFVLANAGESSGRLTLWQSDDGRTWQSRAVPLGRFIPDEHPAAMSLLAAPRPDGSAVVAVAWSQPNGPGAVAGGVFAWVSRDGGDSWGDEERIAQHEPDGVFSASDGRGPVGGFEPSLVYDRVTDSLACSWVEDDLRRTDARRASATNRVVRTLMAARPLTDDAPWRFAVMPNMSKDTPPQLTSWGVRGWLWGDATGTRHWLLMVDERNFQSRLSAQPISLPALLAQGAS